MPIMALRRMAASRTVRVIGPAVSWLAEIGMMPARLTRPTVGLSPTRPLAVAGHTTDPSVSVPTPTMARLALMAAPVPELEPHGLRSSDVGIARLAAASAPAAGGVRGAEIGPLTADSSCRE